MCTSGIERGGGGTNVGNTDEDRVVRVDNAGACTGGDVVVQAKVGGGPSGTCTEEGLNPGGEGKGRGWTEIESPGTTAPEDAVVSAAIRARKSAVGRTL